MDGVTLSLRGKSSDRIDIDPSVYRTIGIGSTLVARVPLSARLLNLLLIARVAHLNGTPNPAVKFALRCWDCAKAQPLTFTLGMYMLEIETAANWIAITAIVAIAVYDFG